MKHEWVEKALYKFIDTRNTVDAGRGMIAFIVTSFKETAYAVIILGAVGIDVRNYPWYITPIMALTLTIIFWCLGKGWRKYRGFEMSNAWGNQFNEMLKGIEKKVK